MTADRPPDQPVLVITKRGEQIKTTMWDFLDVAEMSGAAVKILGGTILGVRESRKKPLTLPISQAQSKP